MKWRIKAYRYACAAFVDILNFDQQQLSVKHQRGFYICVCQKYII